MKSKRFCDATNQLDDVVATVRGEGGHSPSNEELCTVGVDFEADRVRTCLLEQVDEHRDTLIG